MPMIALATCATLIASQAVISGAFSVTRQVVQLGFLPRMTIKHTSAETIGQVYLPAVNWTLFVAGRRPRLGFGSSAKLATAYGIAVMGTLLIDSILFLAVARALWRKPRSMMPPGSSGLSSSTCCSSARTCRRSRRAAGSRCSSASAILLLLTTWHRGRQLVTARAGAGRGPLPDFIDEMHRKGIADADQRDRCLPQSLEGHDSAARSASPRQGSEPFRKRSSSRPWTSAMSRRYPTRTGRIDLLGDPDNRYSHRPFVTDFRMTPTCRGDQRRTRPRARELQPLPRDLLPLSDGAGAVRGPGHGAVAQGPLHGDEPQRRQPGRLLQPSSRARGRPWRSDPVSAQRKNPASSGVLSYAAEWSRTITGVSTHKALNLARLPVPPQPLAGGGF